MEQTAQFFGHFVERFGLGLVIVFWFMFRHERQMTKLVSKVNRLIIMNVVISRTLRLDEDADDLIRAASDEAEDHTDGD